MPSAWRVSILNPWLVQGSTYTKWILISRRKKSHHLQQHRWNLWALCLVLEVRERQYLYELTYLWNLNKKQKQKLVAASVEEGRVNKGDSEDRQRTETPSYHWVSSGDLMYGMVIIANNAILYTWKFLREYLKTSHHTHTQR